MNHSTWCHHPPLSSCNCASRTVALLCMKWIHHRGWSQDLMLSHVHKAPWLHWRSLWVNLSLQLIFLVDSHGLIVELHLSSCLATFAVGRILLWTEWNLFCIYSKLHAICISDASVYSAVFYMHGYIAQHNGEWLIVTANNWVSASSWLDEP